MTARTAPRAIFTMGLPAAGKSTITAETFPALPVLDCDKIKDSHPEYNPKDPAPLHAWSKAVLQGQFETMLSGSDSFVYDSTATDTAKMTALFNAARLAGFEVVLFFVTCTLSESLRRNSQRSRVVPRHVVTRKAEEINAAFDTLAPLADSVETFDNSAPRD